MLGILGLGNYSTLHTIKQLNARANREIGGYSTFPFLMLNIDFETINPFLPDRYKELVPVVSDALEKLHMLGVQEILVPNITLHQVIDQIYVGTDLHKTILHPMHLLRNALRERNVKNTVVFGSRFTMTSPYVGSFIPQGQLHVQRETLLRIDQMRNEVYTQGVKGEHVDQLRTIVLSDFPSGTVCIIACTEISLVASAAELSDSSVVDLMQLQIDAATLHVKSR